MQVGSAPCRTIKYYWYLARWHPASQQQNAGHYQIRLALMGAVSPRIQGNHP
jgi:hypothetical protein